MKANELRIGNWVEVQGITTKAVDVMCDCVNTLHHEDMPMDYVKPIPLTEEWMIKCNIIEKEIETNSTKPDKSRFLKVSEYASYEIPKWIQSVHELQNWYYWKFEKKELTIKT